MLTLADVHERWHQLREQLDTVILGQEGVKEKVLVCLLAGGHALLEGVPGTGKTLLALAVARLVGCRFRRVQFTPDLMPADLLGTNVYNQKTQEFSFRPGPIFTDLLLADEVNRTPPRTQAALLECMQEAAATIDGTRYRISPVFCVLATQNPVEFEGTYPLPEAQRDRFLMKVGIDYPTPEDEARIVSTYASGTRLHQSVDSLTAVMSRDDLAASRQVAEFELLLFQRIEELEARITSNRERLGAGGDSEQYVLQAYAHGLEGIRLGYYAALVGLVENSEVLGIPNEELRHRTEALLYQYAEKVSGRIELFSTSLREMRDRLAVDSANPGLQTAANEISMERAVEIRRLESLLKLMTRIDRDTVLYRSALLRENKTVSLRLFDIEAVKRMLQDGWVETRESLGKNLPDLIFKLLIFALILLLFRALSRPVKHLTASALNRSSADLSVLLKNILVSASGAVVVLLGILVALSQVGISLGPALAGLGVAGFILGFALQDTLGNFAAGGMILIYRPYDVDDFVEVAGTAGLVKRMNLVSTTIITFDNQTLIIPNSKIWGDVIKNVTAQKTRRVDLEFGVSYGEDIDKAERVLTEIVTAHGKVLTDPKPNIRLHKLGDSSVSFVVRPWTRTADYWDVYWDITREVKVRFEREGITIPFPQRDVHLHQPAHST